MPTRRSLNQTFRLDVDFNGLCLFVPEPTAKKMHVLMPRIKNPTSHMPPHVTRIAFDAAHLQPNQDQVSGVMVYIDLDRLALELPPDTGNNSAGSSLHRYIAPIHDFMIEKVARGRLEKIEPTQKVAARVTLTAGDCGQPGGALLWNLKGKDANGNVKEGKHCLTNVVRWFKNGLSGTTLPLLAVKLKRAQPAAAQFTLTTLHPVGKTTKSIRIQVYHLPLAELPPAVNNERCNNSHLGKDPSHFHGFSDLFDQDTAPEVKVAACQCPGVGAGGHADMAGARRSSRLAAADSGSLLTCMLAASSL